MKLYKKLQEIQTNLLATKIMKSGKNTHNRANYYELEDLLPPVKVACNRENVLTYFNFPFDEKIGNHVGELILINLDDPDEKLTFQVPYPQLEKINNGMNIMQSEGAYLTYLKRYLLLNTFDLIEKEVIDSLDWDNDEDTRGIVLDEKPACLSKVVEKCKELYPDEECDCSLLDKVSFKMFRSKELNKIERKEIKEYCDAHKSQ